MLVTTVGRIMVTGTVPFECLRYISPIAFVNTYVFGHPYDLALIINCEKERLVIVRKIKNSIKSSLQQYKIQLS